MRHLLGFVVGIVLAVVGAALGTAGTGELVVATQRAQSSTTGYVLVIVAGVVLGLLAATRRLSPVSPLIGGLLLLAGGVYGWARPSDVLGLDLGLDALDRGLPFVTQFGVPLLIGVLLVVLALVPQARAPRRAKGDDGRDDDGFSAVPQSAPQAWSPPAA